MTGNIVIGIVLILAIIWGINKVRSNAKRGSACCGEREEAVAKTPVADKNKSHYPHHVDMSIGGMTCENCARRVENALNSLPGTWAKVDISGKKASILLKNEPDEGVLRQAVTSAGYSVVDVSQSK